MGCSPHTSFKLQGVVCLQRGEYAQADSFFEKGLALCREFGDRRNAAAMWSNLGESARLRGDFAAAITFYNKALTLASYSGNELDVGIAQRLLGQLLARHPGSSPLAAVGTEEDANEPSQYLNQSLELFKKLNAEGEQARTLRAWGQLELAQDERASGTAKLAAALEIFHRLGKRAEIARTEAVLSQTTIARLRPLVARAQGGKADTELSPPNAPPSPNT